MYILNCRVQFLLTSSVRGTDEEPEQIWYWDDVAVAVAAQTGAEHKPLLGVDNVVPDNDHDIDLKSWS